MSLSLSGSDTLNCSYRFEMRDVSQVGEARRFVAALAEDLGFDDLRRGRLGIIVNELGNNLFNHAKDGCLIVRSLSSWGQTSEAERGIEILSIDRGPGIADIDRSMRDGFSTGSTPGTGLGSVRRQANIFDLHTSLERGTCLLATVHHQNYQESSALLESGAICLPIDGETVAGDAWRVIDGESRVEVVVVDGLGHGPQAHSAAIAAVEAFQDSVGRPPDALMIALHERLRGTRGAAVFAVSHNSDEPDLCCTGVGNIRGVVWSGGTMKGLISQSGTAGLQIKRTVPIRQTFPQGALLILASDGINTRWSLNDYPGLTFRHPSVIAGVIWRDHSRGTDDATVYVGRKK